MSATAQHLRDCSQECWQVGDVRVTDCCVAVEACESRARAGIRVHAQEDVEARVGEPNGGAAASAEEVDGRQHAVVAWSPCAGKGLVHIAQGPSSFAACASVL